MTSDQARDPTAAAAPGVADDPAERIPRTRYQRSDRMFRRISAAPAMFALAFLEGPVAKRPHGLMVHIREGHTDHVPRHFLGHIRLRRVSDQDRSLKLGADRIHLGVEVVVARAPRTGV